ncbi:omega-hydroxypalmitate O-feruloyl transferase-like [Rhodamnia argentea]|uniref:Omega-hydroxypalmitate O-feruloyl transferase-like n=1 Tax=Rhodamnia argentea TaxID=178133 RepID=A0A8B8PJP6_9MYRT|nr:omega-hydroxypalmitate O-feruloyl transferase-like [Rhodamnia argentea]
MEAFNTNASNILTVERSAPVPVLPEQDTPGGSIFLSSIDNVALTIMSTVYSFNRSDADVAGVIKQALSKVLVYYYPLAGRLAKNSQGKLIVDCQKKFAVPFVEASANCDIENLGDIQIMDSGTLGKLVYRDPTENMLEDGPLLTAQVTRFKCGSFTLGIALHHCMVDGMGAFQFVNSWAELARGKPLSIVPCHDRTILKPRVPPQISGPYDDFVHVSDVSNFMELYQREQMVFKSFHFDGEKLAILRKMATPDGHVMSSCSNFVALSALVWRSRSMALKMKPHQLSKLLLTVDIRPKLGTSMRDGYFGNAIIASSCLCTAGQLIDESISSTAGKIKEAIERVTEDYVRSSLDFMDTYQFDPYSVSSLLISSWLRLDYSCIDFGWGGPRQFGTGNPPPNLCMFMREDTENKKGIVVVLGLPLSAMNTFQELVQI